MCYSWGIIFFMRIIGVFLLKTGISRQLTSLHRNRGVNLGHILTMIIKFFTGLTPVAQATNIFMIYINNISRWLKILSEISRSPQKYIVLEVRILFPITPEYLASSQCMVSVVDPLEERESVSKVH